MRLALASLLILFISVVAALEKPYAPHLFDRESLQDVKLMRKREVRGQPHYPSLFDRDEVVQRGIRKGPLLDRDDDEETSLVARWWKTPVHKSCQADKYCDKDQYCSTKKHKCYKKLSNKKTCSRDGACRSEYCGRTSGKCSSRKSNGTTCKYDAHCVSGYCSGKHHVCKSKAKEHDSCVRTEGCKEGLTCWNGNCEKKKHHHQPKPHHPHPPHPHPSGTHKDPKYLKASRK